MRTAAVGIKQGDYVLATKWHDADPQDHWAVGFYDKQDDRGRHYVVDSDGTQFRGNGFRRVYPISRDNGAYMLANASTIEGSGRPVTDFLWS